MRRFLVFLSGAQADVLANIPADQAKYEVVGFSILFTGVMACVSMSFALHTALSVALALALLAATGWGLLIIGLDRMLVVSMNRDRSWLNRLLIVFRLVFGLLLSVVISTPIVLEIFRSDIDQQISVIHERQISAFETGLSMSQLAADIAYLSAQVQMLTAQDAQPSGLTALRRQYSTDKNRAAAAYAVYQCQLYGGPGCTRGRGPKERTAYSEYLSYKAQAGQVLAQINELRAGFPGTVASNQAQLAQDQQTLSSDQRERRRLESKFAATTAANTGLLIRLKALSEATARHATLQFARWILFSLFTLIECTPVLSKLMLIASKEPNTYEQAVEFDGVKQFEAQKIISADRLNAAQALVAEREVLRSQIARAAVAAELRSRLPLYVRLRGYFFFRQGPVLPSATAMYRQSRRLAGRKARMRVGQDWQQFPDHGIVAMDGQLPPVFLQGPEP